MTEQRGNVNLGQFILGASFCRQTSTVHSSTNKSDGVKEDGGVHIYVSKDIQFDTINPDQYNKEKDLEICAFKVRLLSSSFTIICFYRTPTGNVTYFKINLNPFE